MVDTSFDIYNSISFDRQMVPNSDAFWYCLTGVVNPNSFPKKTFMNFKNNCMQYQFYGCVIMSNKVKYLTSQNIVLKDLEL